MDRTEINSDTRYLADLGLARPPFPGGVDDAPFFYDDARKKTLDAVLYLARYSDLVPLIHGPGGSGKTAFRREIARCAGPNVHVASIAGDAALNASALCARFLGSFSLVDAFSLLDDQLPQIKEQIDLLQRKGYHCILLVDDAHILPPDTYAMLETLINLRGESGKSLINLVMFAPHPDRLQLEGPTLRHRLKPMPLTPLSAEENARYLRHRFAYAGNSAVFDRIFRARDVSRIGRESKGWPGTINALAQQVLLRYVAKTHPAVTPPDAPRQGRMQIVLASVLGIVLVAGFAFQSEVTDMVNAARESRANNVASAQAPFAPSLVPVDAAIPPTSSLHPTEAAPSTVAAIVAATPDTKFLETVESNSVTVAAVAPPAPPTDTDPADTPRAPEADSSPDVAPAPRVIEDVVDAEIHAQGWILSQNPAAYTVQLVGSSDQGDVRRALKRHALRGTAATFSTKRKDKKWYGLIYGVYPDFNSARRARAALPETLVKHAWVRRVSAIQGEIAESEPRSTPLPETAKAASARSPRKPQP